MSIPARLDPDELRALLHLRALSGIGDRTLADLLARHGSAQAALEAPAAELGARAARERGSRRVLGRVDQGFRTLERDGVVVLVRGRAGYPPALEDLYDPPALLFARGRLELLDRPALAVVGARRPTADGLAAARLLAGELSRAGLVIVSGMARGIDSAAHEAALANGTIGVLGCGIDVVYPREEAELFARVASEGLLLSEFLPGEPPQPHNFPRRNRIIAALSVGVLVVEAADKSGAMITVDHALDMGREVFAVPGSIVRPTSAGTNRLIQEGATMVVRAADVIEPLVASGKISIQVPAPPAREAWDTPEPEGLDPSARSLWVALDLEPRHVDALAAAAGLSVPEALAGLLEMELRGYARQVGGMRFVRGEGSGVGS